jgi:superkiller protein 3
VASVYNDLAKVYLNEGQTVAALATYQIGEAIDPKNPDIISGIGYCQAAFGHDQEAVRRMRQALAINPNYAYAHEWLGRHYTQAGDWENAVKELEAWSKADPDSRDARNMLQDARDQLNRRRALESGRLFGPG